MMLGAGRDHAIIIIYFQVVMSFTRENVVTFIKYHIWYSFYCPLVLRHHSMKCPT